MKIMIINIKKIMHIKICLHPFRICFSSWLIFNKSYLYFQFVAKLLQQDFYWLGKLNPQTEFK